MKKDILKYSFKEGLKHEIEILNISELYENFYHDITNPHRAAFYQIIWFQKGNSKHFIDFKTIETCNNSLLFINKDNVQKFDTNSNSEGKVLLFTDSFLCKTKTDIELLKSNILFNDLISIPKIKISKVLNPITEVFKSIQTELNNETDAFQADILRNHLRNLLSHSERERRKQGFEELKKNKNLEYLLQLKDAIDTHYVSQKSVKFYADILNTTPKRLNQATKAVLDVNPKEVIRQRVLLEAKRLLVHTNDSIKEIGFCLGFEEPTNFVKYFKQNLSKTPAEFRENFISRL